MKNLFINYKEIPNLQNKTLNLPFKLGFLKLNLLFIKINNQLYFNPIDKIEYSDTTPKAYTTIILRFTYFKEIDIGFLRFLYSDAQIKSIDLHNASLEETVRYNFKYAYVSIDFLAATQKDYIAILNDYAENILDDMDFPSKQVPLNKVFKDYIDPFKNYKEATYAKIIQVGETYHLTLTTNRMWHLDFLYMTNLIGDGHNKLKALVENYKPYFYEFIPSTTLALKERYEKNPDAYYVVSFHKTKQEESLIAGTIEYSVTTFIHRPIRLKLTPLTMERDKALLQFIEKKIKAAITDEQKMKNKIDKQLAGNLAPKQQMSVSFYNMGNANACQIIVDHKAKVMLDFGFDNKNNYHQEIKTFMATLPTIELIMLSNWDLTNIKGISQFKMYHYKKKWIVPEPLVYKVSHSALRIICYLIKELSQIALTIVSRNLSGQIIVKNEYCTLGKGSGRGNGAVSLYNGERWFVSYSHLNNLGLVMALHPTQETAVLFPGNCEYSEIPDEMKQSYTLLVASQHGANLNGIALPTSLSNSACIAFAQQASRYPYKKHLSLLKEKGYEILPLRSQSLLLSTATTACINCAR